MSTSTKAVVLQFPDLDQLWTFSQKLQIREMHITTWNKTLRFRGTEDEIMLALTSYSAKVYNDMELQN